MILGPTVTFSDTNNTVRNSPRTIATLSLQETECLIPSARAALHQTVPTIVLSPMGISLSPAIKHLSLQHLTRW